MDDMPKLPDGTYPFADQRLPLAELAMIEAPVDLERLIRTQAAAAGIELIRGEPVELRLGSDEHPDATFLVYWPLDGEKLHMLAPRASQVGRA